MTRGAMGKPFFYADATFPMRPENAKHTVLDAEPNLQTIPCKNDGYLSVFTTFRAFFALIGLP